MTDTELTQRLADIDKTHAEIQKLLAEAGKVKLETIMLPYTLGGATVAAIIGATVTFLKLFS